MPWPHHHYFHHYLFSYDYASLHPQYHKKSCLGCLAGAFFLDQCSKHWLYLVFEYCLHSIIIYQTLLIYHLEQTLNWVISSLSPQPFIQLMQFFFSETKTEGIALIKESKFAYINVLITKYVTKMLAMRVTRIMGLTSL